MKRMKMVFGFDGSDFAGSQKQPHKRTVQGEIEKVLSKIDEQPIALVMSGRTDAKVHAIRQVAHFDVKRSSITAENIRYMFKRQLPPDIVVEEVCEVDNNFHARFDAIKKTYCFRIKSLAEEKMTAFDTRYFTFSPEQIDVKKMNDILVHYIGTHDFSSFTVTPRHKKQLKYERTISACYCEYNPKHQCYDFIITGDGFLQYMIRIIVGFSFEIYKGNETVEKITELFETKDIKYVNAKAEPQGLYLQDVFYY